MPISVIDISTTIKLNSSVVVPGRHLIDKRQLSGSSKIWFCKESNSPLEARSEVLADEFFRLILPHQPKARLAENCEMSLFYVLSEAIAGYRYFPVGEQERFNAGEYSGLGQILVVAALLQEIDLKLPNHIGVDHKKKVYKIDGDWSFASILDPKRYQNAPRNITPELLANLPLPFGIYAHNWLDYIVDNKCKNSQLFNNALPGTPHFRGEINQAILSIILLPAWYIDKFVDAYMPAGAQKFSDFIHERCEQLRHCAMQDSSFQAYVKSESAEVSMNKFLKHIRCFKAGGVEAILNDVERKQLAQEVTQAFNELCQQRFEPLIRSQGMVKINWPVMNKSLLQSLVQPFVNVADEVQNNFMAQLFSGSTTSSSSSSTAASINEIRCPRDVIEMLAGLGSQSSFLVEKTFRAYVCSIHERYRLVAMSAIAYARKLPLSVVMKHCSNKQYAMNVALVQTSSSGLNALMLAILDEPLAIKPLLSAMAPLNDAERAAILWQQTVGGCHALMLALMFRRGCVKFLLEVIATLPRERIEDIFNMTRRDGKNVMMVAGHNNNPELMLLRAFIRDHNLDEYRTDTAEPVEQNNLPVEPKSESQHDEISRFSPYVQQRFFKPNWQARLSRTEDEPRQQRTI